MVNRPPFTEPSRNGVHSDGKPVPPASMPQVIIGHDEHRVTDECLPGLAMDPDLYQRGGEFVIVREDEDTRTPVIAPVMLPDLRRRITRRVRLFQIKKKKRMPAHPPEFLPPQLATHPTKAGIRHLSGLSGVPVLRPDGSIHDRAGYDAETQTVYVPAGLTIPTVPVRLTQSDAVQSSGVLLDLVRDFPFGDPAGKSVYLSFVMSALARHLIDGGVPLHLADANVRGSGKGLILDTAGVILLGGPVPVQQYTADTAEMRKVITAVVRAGKTMQHLDNLPTGEPFGNAALDSALTCSVWEDRLLGQNLKVAYPHRVVWAASGNNPTIRADSMRRLIRVRLESSRANPEDRSDFAYPDLLAHVRENRGKYVAAALTLAAAYLRAGRPAVTLPAAGSFTGWTQIVRAALVWAGQPDPWQTNLAAREELDTEKGELDALIDAWSELDPTGEGVTTAQAKKSHLSLYVDTPRTAELLALLGLKEFDAGKIGCLLRKHKGRWTGDGRAITAASGHGGVSRWRVIERRGSHPHHPHASGGDGGNGGDDSHATRVRRSNSVPGSSGEDAHHAHHPLQSVESLGYVRDEFEV
jgi:hypothetical protein